MPAISMINNFQQDFLQHYPKIRHFVVLARLNNPIGIYLLLWPTLWGLWFAAEGFPGWHLFIVFTLGTVLTRSAGCIINDIADRKFDLLVKRTKNRPLATGDLALFEAVAFMTILLFISLILVLTTNWLTVGLAGIAAGIAAIYPYTKRFTHMPQVVLGVAFSFGIPMAFAATLDTVPNIAWLLLAANVVWTVAYDTQYAMVDRDDDLRIGLKSTAILFADMDKLMIGLLQILFIFTMLLLVRLVDLSWPYYLGLAVTSALFLYQQVLIRDRERLNCLRAFRSNHWAGLSIFTGVLFHFWITIGT